MNCNTFRNDCVDLLLPSTTSPRLTLLASHLGACPSCKAHFEELEKTVGAVRPVHKVEPAPHLNEIIMKRIQDMEKAQGETQRWKRGALWGAAPVTLLLVVSVVILLDMMGVHQGGDQAFALEKVVEAYRDVRFIHLRLEMSEAGKPSDIWAEFGNAGNLQRLRVDVAASPDSTDGPKIVIWQLEMAEVWLENKNLVMVIREPEILRSMRMTVDTFDPRRLAERLLASAREGDEDIHIRQSRSKAGDVETTVSRESNNTREEYHIDPKTNLVTCIEGSSRKDGITTRVYRVDYEDYNNPPNPSVFDLHLPEDVVRVDQKKAAVGLLKGSRSDAEASLLLVKKFWEAVIAKDFGRAGRFVEGIPGTYLREQLDTDGVVYLRIVSIGEPVPGSLDAQEGLEVPWEIEVKENEELYRKKGIAFVHPVSGQPERLTIASIRGE